MVKKQTKKRVSTGQQPLKRDVQPGSHLVCHLTNDGASWTLFPRPGMTTLTLSGKCLVQTRVTVVTSAQVSWILEEQVTVDSTPVTRVPVRCQDCRVEVPPQSETASPAEPMVSWGGCPGSSSTTDGETTRI